MDSDEALARRVREGEIEAFDRLYERYEARLYAYLRAILGDRDDAEEILHDTFLAVLEDGNARFEHEGAFRGWRYRVGRNLAFNRRRAPGRRDRTVAAAGEAIPGEVPRRADEALETAQLETALVGALGRLPAALGELWHLWTSGLSYEQIASVVDVPLGTVKSRMHQMVNVLREELKPWIVPE